MLVPPFVEVLIDFTGVQYQFHENLGPKIAVSQNPMRSRNFSLLLPEAKNSCFMN